MIDDIVKIEDYNINKKLLLQQYKDKVKFEALITGMNNMANNFETALFEIRDNYTIETAISVQLDVLGEIQRETRNSLDDEIYRNRIKAKILINNGSGEHEIIILSLKVLCSATRVHVRRIPNLNSSIWTDIEITNLIFDSLLKMLMTGVGLYVVYGSNNPFVFFGDNDGEGFGKLDPTLSFSDFTEDGGELQVLRSTQ